MEKRIELEKRGRSPDQIKEICLDNCRSPTISGLDESFVNLEVLSMINIGLTSLKGFPKLPNLRRLELSDNRISNGLNHLQGSSKLEYLNLCGNRFKELESLEPLKELTNLEILDLFNCEVTELENYREHVFNLIPNLKYLDGYDRNNKEIEDEVSVDEDNLLAGEDEEDENDENANGVLDSDEDEDDDDDDIDDDDDEEEEGADNEEDEEDHDSDLDDPEGEEDEEADDEVGLSYLAQDDIDEENEENDFVPGEEDEDDDDLDEEEADEDAQTSSKGEKRKQPDEDAGDESVE